LKLGSLFSGSGTCELAAALCGIEPVWASEIEKFPIQVTTKRFPNMKHLGDITKINGTEIEPVDIVTFGSPCTDMSIAGKRAGLAGKQSSLFMEAIRIIREMRSATNNECPRYILWENVPGAFSSNKGLDFRTVLEKIAESDIPMPDKRGWATAGMVELPERQIAWRVLDAQYWGVPQRRKRIFLVADFRGKRAGEILFIEKSLPRDSETGGEEGKGFAANSEGSIDDSIWPSIVGSIVARADGSPCVDRGQPFVVTAGFMAGQGTKSGGVGYQEEVFPTLKSILSGGNAIPSIVTYPDIAGTLCASGAGLNRPAGQGNEIDLCIVQRASAFMNKSINQTVCGVAYGIGNGQVNQSLDEEKVGALNCMHDQQAVFTIGGYGDYKEGCGTLRASGSNNGGGSENLIAGLDCRHGKENGNLCGTLLAKEGGGYSYSCTHPVRIGRSVRRLTPVECV